MVRGSRRPGAHGYQPLRGDSEGQPSLFPSLGRRVSPERDERSAERPLDRLQRHQPQPTINKTIAPGQPAPGGRSKAKFVTLPGPEPDAEDSPKPLNTDGPARSIFEDLESEQNLSPRNHNDDRTPTSNSDVTINKFALDEKGKITVVCMSEALDRELLTVKLREKGAKFLRESQEDVLYGQYMMPTSEVKGDIFYFDYGVVAFWGLEKYQEQDILKSIVEPCQENPLPAVEKEVDEFTYHYSISEKPHIQNDNITMHHRFAGDYRVKLSISHALAQSTKLCVFEERVLKIVQETKELPETLASTGKVALSRKEIAKLIGRVYLQRAAVNLLGTVLDTPEFFWSAPDSMQSLYKRVCEYLELDQRVEVLNNRFQVLQEMLDMLHEHQNQVHAARLEIIVIWLIVVEVLVGLFESASILGWVGKEH